MKKHIPTTWFDFNSESPWRSSQTPNKKQVSWHDGARTISDYKMRVLNVLGLLNIANPCKSPHNFCQANLPSSRSFRKTHENMLADFRALLTSLHQHLSFIISTQYFPTVDGLPLAIPSLTSLLGISTEAFSLMAGSLAWIAPGVSVDRWAVINSRLTFH